MITEKQCREIYREAFKDDDSAFEDKLFKHCFKYCRVLKRQDDVVAMLFALPCKIVTDAGYMSAYYIYAAATRKEYRNNGYMKALIENLKQDADAILFLKPANDGLVAFYEKLGFTQFSASIKETGEASVELDSDFKIVADGELEYTGEQMYKAMYYYDQKLNLDNLCFPYVME